MLECIKSKRRNLKAKTLKNAIKSSRFFIDRLSNMFLYRFLLDDGDLHKGPEKRSMQPMVSAQQNLNSQETNREP